MLRCASRAACFQQPHFAEHRSLAGRAAVVGTTLRKKVPIAESAARQRKAVQRNGPVKREIASKLFRKSSKTTGTSCFDCAQHDLLGHFLNSFIRRPRPNEGQPHPKRPKALVGIARTTCIWTPTRMRLFMSFHALVAKVLPDVGVGVHHGLRECQQLVARIGHVVRGQQVDEGGGARQRLAPAEAGRRDAGQSRYRDGV